MGLFFNIIVDAIYTAPIITLLTLNPFFLSLHVLAMDKVLVRVQAIFTNWALFILGEEFQAHSFQIAEARWEGAVVMLSTC